MVGLAARVGPCPWDTVSLWCFNMISVATTICSGALVSPQNSGSMSFHPVMLTCISFWLKHSKVVRSGVWLLWCFKHPQYRDLAQICLNVITSI